MSSRPGGIPNELHDFSGVEQSVMTACPFLLGVVLTLAHVGLLYWCCRSPWWRSWTTTPKAFDVRSASARFGPGMAKRRAAATGWSAT